MKNDRGRNKNFKQNRLNTGKTFTAFVLAAFFLLSSFVPILSSQDTQNSSSTVLITTQSSGEVTEITYTINGYSTEDVFINDALYSTIRLQDESNIMEKDAPDLPNICRSIIIPDDAKMNVHITSQIYDMYDNILIAPSKGILPRTVNPQDVPYAFGSVYTTDAWYPQEIAELETPYIFHDYRGQVVILYPFQYNPVTKQLRVYTHVTIEVVPEGPGDVNVFHRSNPLTALDRDFSYIYQSHFLNFNNNPSLYTPVSEQGEMLVICYDSFYTTMQPFIAWKNMKGIPTNIVKLSTIGTTADQIDAYITNYYNTHDLTFVLLVGDIAQMPSLYYSGHASDPSFAYIVGSDYYPDIFIGRFSAQTTDQLVTQVERSIEYEKYPQTSASWYHKGLGIGSNEGTGDDNEYDWEHIRNLRTGLLGFTYTSVDELYDGSHGGQDADGNPTTSNVAASVNDGRSIINYCGHGGATGWSTTGFSNSNVDALTNQNKLPFIIMVACNVGEFEHYDACFAEAWMRATDGGEPAGAIGVYASTQSQSWDPPMEAQDEITDLLVNEAMNTFGGLCFSGAMSMMDKYPSYYDETNTWTVFGDPSLQVRTDTPASLNIQYDTLFPSGATSFDVSIPAVENALCAISSNGILLGSGYTDENGDVTITFSSPVTDVDQVDLVVTAFNTLTYSIPIDVGAPLRQPAEFETDEAVLIRYPFGISYTIISEMSEDVKVYTVVASSSEQTYVTSQYITNGVNMANVDFLIAPTDTYWTRDYGPWFVINETSGDLEVVDFTYNRPRPNDDAIPGVFAADQGLDLSFMDITHTGGNYMTDGHGIAASTDLVYTENTDMTHDEINQTVAEYLGIQLYQVVPDPLGEYIEHIDCWGKFLSPDTIMIIQVSTSHSHYAAIEAMATYWANQISYYGTPYNVVRVYTHLQEPYINSIIINKKVLVPITGSAYDANALAAYQAAMPGYEIIGFTGSWENTDALHCRVKEVPDRGMLYIDHKPIGDQNVSLTGYPISATVIPYSGAALVAGYPKLIWKNQTITWTTIQMTLSEDNIYTATIPSQPYGSIVSYYISAADVSGRQEYQPYMGALDPHIFTIEMPSLSYQPTSYNFGTMNAGETDSTTFQIWNGGSGTLSYSLSESSSWLDITPASGSSTGEHDVITVNINTTVLSMGPHVCDISISSNGGSGLVSILVNIIPEEVLDQNQSQYTNNFALYTTRWGGQSFKPTYDLLTRVQLYLRKAGSITTDAVVSIRSSLTGADLVSVVKPASQIPTTNSWVEFDFSDLTVTPGNTYYIILRTTGGTSTNSYSWGYGSGTPYSNGVLWYSSNSGSTWTQYSAYDFCFKTYGLPSMPPVPALSYNPFSYSFGNVASGTTGSTSFDIWNSGTGTLSYTLTEYSSWVIVTPLSGTSTGEHDTITVNIDTTSLSPGSYNCPISITSNGGSGTFTVYLVVIVPTPVLAYTPTSYNFGDIIAGWSGSTSLDLWNSGTGILTYGLSESSGWVTVSPTSGSSSGEHDIITVNIDTTGLTVGSYSCDIAITSNGGSGTFTVTVNIILPAPILSYTPTSYNFGDMVAGATGSTSFQIWNSGTGTLTYSLSESSSWVTVSPLSGTSTGEHDTITVNVDTAGLSPGSYSCPVSISSDGGTGMFTVYVNIVTVVPVFTYTPTSYSFGSMEAGHTASTTFQIWNSGTGTLTYSFSESASWVTVSPTSGSSTGEHDTITVNVDTTGLSVGSYSCPISISSNGGSGTFTVSLTVIELTEVLDQQQTTYTNNFALYTTRWGGQSFIPTVTTLTRVEVYIRKAGSPPADAVLTVRSSISGADLASVSKPASAISTTNSWVEFDFTDLTVTPGSTYYLVLRTSSGSSTNCYYWGYGSGSPYADGVLYYSATGGSSWTSYATYDFCFKTYGISAPPTPALSYSPTSHDFGSVAAGATGSATFEIWNSGTGTLTYSLSESTSWASVSPTSGSSTGEHDTITVSINTAGLTPGSYMCPVSITSNGGTGTFTATVTIISPTPTLAYNPTFHSFGDMTAGSTSFTTFEVWNSGTGTLTYSLSESTSWITSVSPASGSSTGEHDTITVSIDTTGMSVGSYSGPVSITSDGGSGTFTVSVNIVTVAPTLSYSPTSYTSPSMTPGHTAQTTFQIWNSGTGGTLTYSFTESATWVTVSPTSGSSTGEHDTITVTVDTTGMTPGTYTCPISISTNAGSGTFTVYLTVIAATETIDQQQTQYNNNFALYTTRWGGQSFKPTLGTLTRVELFMRKAGIPPTDIVLSVRSSISGADLVSVSKPASAISTSNGWVEFDFTDLTVTPGSTYYLVLKTTSGTSTNCYYWGYGTSTPYTNGILWYSATGGSSWIEYSTYDFDFKTYGV